MKLSMLLCAFPFLLEPQSTLLAIRSRSRPGVKAFTASPLATNVWRMNCFINYFTEGTRNFFYLIWKMRDQKKRP
jgi:hypothetical protein